LPDTIDWKKERPQKTELLKEAESKADKQLAHLSAWRIKIVRDGKKPWSWVKIREDMEKVIAKFESLK